MTTEEREGLRLIRRRRFWLWFFVLTGLPAIWMAKRITHAGIGALAATIIWVAAILWCTSRVALSRCPRCGGYFHSKTGSALAPHISARGCVRCGLPVGADRVIYPSME